MQITELPRRGSTCQEEQTPFYIATQQWALEPWKGEDRPDLGRS